MGKSKHASFFMFDFHVHSPASYDVRSSRYKYLSDEEKKYLENIPVINTKDLQKYESEVLENFKVEDYYNLLVERKNRVAKNENLDNGNDWSVIAITDHNVCTYSTRLSNHAFKKDNLRMNRLIILPGIELDIKFKFNRIENKENWPTVHVLLIFKPNTMDRAIFSSINKYSCNDWDFGKELEVDNLAQFINNMRNDEKYPCIAIAAHISSSKGIQKETSSFFKEKISKNNEAKQIIAADIDSEYIKTWQNNILEFLGKCGFDALQMTGKKDCQHYSSLNRYKDDQGRAVGIISSDAHKVDDIFKCKNMYEKGKYEEGVPFIKLKNINSKISEDDIFKLIRDRAIRQGETRVKYSNPGVVYEYIQKLVITKESPNCSSFWFEEGETELTIDLSSNLNCLIGGRGSGKSSIIESIIFCTLDEYCDLDKKTDEYKRASVTLKGCKIKVYMYINKGGRKQSIVLERYFEESGHFGKIKTYIVKKDKEKNEILEPVSDIEIPKIQAYRYNEIERATDSKGLRKIFDDICENIEEFNIHIDENLKKLQDNRKEIINLVKKRNELLLDGKPLRKYIDRLYKYKLSDKPEIKDKYNKIDKIVEVNKTLGNIKLYINNDIYEPLSKTKFKENIVTLNEGLKRYQGKITQNEYYKYITPIIEALEKSQIILNINLVETGINSILESVNKSLNCLHKTHEDSQSELLREGIPVGGEEREINRNLLDESKLDLDNYKDIDKKIKDLLKQRSEIGKDLYIRVEHKSKKRKDTAQSITENLSKVLDNKILIIEADAQEQQDKDQLKSWIYTYLLKSSRDKEQQTLELIEKGLDVNLIKSMVNEEQIKFDFKNDTQKKKIYQNLEYRELIKLCEREDLIVDKTILNEDELKYFTEGIELIKDIDTYEHILELDEIILEDLPVIKLNDRPLDHSNLKNIENLSPGQRCSAILPILLLNGNGPLVIDQPEDNLDNRLIKQVIINVLSSIKLRRQVIMATHNPNMPVLGDAEEVIVLKATEDDKSIIEKIGDIDEKDIINKVTDIMEGGREAFQYRASLYNIHWKGGAYIVSENIK
ncbi:AAA family ATPase [Paraclostridium sordellii]|uniref:AAA family ATPase n=1 Tax=Paraclostridium sordellii TaxID=1505 RepID=UPI0005E394D4|nr:AAA family ATPase [Paeniclostridium sordellii]CEN24450.1 DNA repair ATPase [[Clostridium] sordellii] [Paeniclostridium sordellii]